MSLIGRLIVIFIGFLAACFVGGMIVVVALLFPEFSDLGAGPVDQGAIDILLGFGFIFVSGFALVPALIVRDHRSALYPQRARLCRRRRVVGACLLSRPGPLPSDTLQFEGIVRRHLEIMTGAGIVAGVVYWLIAGRNAGAWRNPPPLQPPPPLPSKPAVTALCLSRQSRAVIPG